MKPRAKTLLVAATLTLVVGVCGAWPLLRSHLLQARLDRALLRLHGLGLRTQVSAIQWEGLWTAKLDSISAFENGKKVLDVQNIVVTLAPQLSLSGSEWVKRIAFEKTTLSWRGLEAAGSGWLVPASLAGGWDGQLTKGKFDGKSMAAACELRLISFGQTWLNRKRKNDIAFSLRDLHAFHPMLGDSVKQFGEVAGFGKLESGFGKFDLQRGSWFSWEKATIWANGHWDSQNHSFALQTALPLQPVQAILDPVAALAPEWLAGIQATGSVDGHFELSAELDSLETLHIDGALTGHGIQVKQYGSANLENLPAIAHSPAFFPLNQLPEYLVQAVVLSEDAGFWDHQGFDKDIIRLAMVENLEERRFVRGAGTIPMQLMRNIFLHHGKQADRKLAEVTLTWLAQSQNILSKEEELTCYLNLIEWGEDGSGTGPGDELENGSGTGPGDELEDGLATRRGDEMGKSIFGIRAAAWRYFRKAPQQLNVDEAIFLACIIPNPRHAAALLEDDGSLTPYAQEYFDTMRWMLYEGDWIGEEWLEAEYPVFRRART
ncbi:MAG: hypothetical protein RLZZ519_612 [Bacteroidota bacterium]|jgi:hypothetical protein